MITHESRVATIERARRALARRRLAHAVAADESARARDMLAVVSHDLRNPLATIAMALGRLGD
jgi:signal transduction histidine kinase